MVFGGTYSSCLYLLFLSWYKKRRQKKIKASSEAGETGRIHDENRKRDAFSDCMIVISRKRITFCAFIIIKMVFGGTYSSCLYLLFLSWYKKRKQKKIKASAEAGEDGRIHDGNRKRTTFGAFAILGMMSGEAYAIRPYMKPQKINAFSGNTVGAYYIRPTNVQSMERIT